MHYPHVGDRLLRGKKSFFHLLALGIALILIVLHHEVMLTAGFNGYMLFGIINELRITIFPSQRPPAWNVDAPPAAAPAGNEAPLNADGGAPQTQPAQDAVAPPPATQPAESEEPHKTETYRI